MKVKNVHKNIEVSFQFSVFSFQFSVQAPGLLASNAVYNA